MVVVKFLEDLLLFSRWFREIIGRHGFGNFRVETHKHVKGLEVDVVVYGKYGTIGIELKDSDYGKVIQQAVERAEYFTYMYAVLDLPVRSILSILRTYKEALEYGIGFASSFDDCVVIPAYSKHKHEAKRYVGLLQYIPEVVGSDAGCDH